ncbi:hypothetical protein K2173_014366 [Erythroxylum novogranatense]|uniref:Uncharacterized protein n=1 Tax=Erythroxylum novogranatense TaxID=1862640 RepID=A0AAV8S5N6_9ROSI|nr:hypothetical protein K2173_014366 [Erythroxylum novogranatense]
MARTNKYTSINFNHIYEKNLGNSSTLNPPKSQPSSSSSSSSSFYSSVSPSSYQNNPYNKNNIASVKGHGRMLVLTRPNPKPVSVGSTAPQASPPQNLIDPISPTGLSSPKSHRPNLRKNLLKPLLWCLRNRQILAPTS